MNCLLEFEHLNNRYFAMRHGHSLANQRAIIVSQPENGLDGFGLSDQGRVQVRESLQLIQFPFANTIIVSSDFCRARESAEIAAHSLDAVEAINLDRRLRERNFGELELTADSGYDDVWKADAENPDHQVMGVESVNQVMERVTSVIVEYENCCSNTSILLVSHGDALQILETAFARMDGSEHRQLEHLHTAQIRELQFG
ncbi:MAG: phosphoglycerate mutase family protein [Gammaproteobacteria bacterium]|nr:phosphoglycerate mutase family protein [Gammaproteobacteria bacterium]